MSHTWLEWLKNWRPIADESSKTEYIAIMANHEGEEFEVLRISRFHEHHDGDRPHVETSIRDFNDKTAAHSRVTRDLGVVRVITNKHQPAFVLEPGADVLEWRAMTQGVSVKTLVHVMRAGELGRRVRRRDRRALKASHEQMEAARTVFEQDLADARFQVEDATRRLAEGEAQFAEAMRDRDRMKMNLIEQNMEQLRAGHEFPMSGTKSGALGKAQDRGQELTTNKPWPGHYKG